MVSHKYFNSTVHHHAATLTMSFCFSVRSRLFSSRRVWQRRPGSGASHLFIGAMTFRRVHDSTQLPWGDLQLAIWTKPDTRPTPPRTVSHPPPPLPGALPPGYEAVVDSNSGLTYYANRVTGHSTWNERDCAPPTVYESFVDPKSGNTYYANWATGHSVWTMRECLPQGEQIPMAATAQQEHNVAAVATRGRWRRPIANGPTLQLPGATAPAHGCTDAHA